MAVGHWQIVCSHCQHLHVPPLQGGNVLALDPCLAEEAAMEGSVTLAINPQSELCAVQKADGIGLDYSQLMRCAWGLWVLARAL